MTRYQAVLFDVDGTLVHSSPGILQTMAYTFEKMGKDSAQMDLSRYLGPPLRRTFGEHFSDPADVEKAVDIYRRRYETDGQFGCVLYPGVEEMLRRLKDAGIGLYTATSKPRQVVLPILQRLGIVQWFDMVGGASMDSSIDTKTQVIQHVLTQPQLAGAHVLMVGDRKDDMIGAADCHLDAAAVLYGYGSREELAPFSPCFWANDCSSLADWLLEEITQKKGV